MQNLRLRSAALGFSVSGPSPEHLLSTVCGGRAHRPGGRLSPLLAQRSQERAPGVGTAAAHQVPAARAEPHTDPRAGDCEESTPSGSRVKRVGNDRKGAAERTCRVSGVRGRSLAALCRATPSPMGRVRVGPPRCSSCLFSGRLLPGDSGPAPRVLPRVSPRVPTEPEDSGPGAARWGRGQEHAPAPTRPACRLLLYPRALRIRVFLTADNTL